MTLRIKKNLDDKRLYDTWLDASQDSLRSESERVKDRRFVPLVARWQSQNKTRFNAEHQKSTNGAKSTIFADDQSKPLFPWVHMTGVRPHVIRATKPHGLLVFRARNGNTVFTKRPINHPGFKPTGEVDKINREELPTIAKAVSKAGSDAINRA